MALHNKPEDYKNQVHRYPRPSDRIDPKLKKEKEFYLAVAENMMAEYTSGMMATQFSWYQSRPNAILRDYARGRQSPDKIKKWLLGRRRKQSDGRYITAMNVSFEGYPKLPQLFDMMRSKNMNHEYDVDINCVDEASIAAREATRSALKYLVDERTKAFIEGAKFKPNFEINPDELGIKTQNQVDTYIDAGGFTLQWQMAAIAACHKTKIISNYKELQDMCMDDLITNKDGFTGARTYIDRSTGEVKIRRVDVEKAIVPYFEGISSEGKITRAGEIRELTIADLRRERPDLSESEIVYIARSFGWMNKGMESFFSGERFRGSAMFSNGNYSRDPIDSCKILVLDYQFLSTDVKTFVKNEERGFFREVDFEHRLTRKEAKNGEEVVKKNVIKKYEAIWIIGTKMFLRYGECSDVVYYGEEGNRVPGLDYFFVKTGNMSLVERCIAIVDDLNMILVKNRNIWATLPASPAMMIQKDLIENVMLNGKAQQPEDILQSFIERGVYYYNGLDDFGKPLYMAGGQKPIEFADVSRIANMLAVCSNEMLNKVNELREVLGLTQGADGGERSPYLGLGEQRIAIEQSNASLAPTFNAYRYLFKAMFTDVIKKWQIQAKKKNIKLPYSLLGNKNMKMLELAGNFTVADFNCEVTISPGLEDKQALLNELIQLKATSSQSGGSLGVTYSEFMYVREKIMAGNIKEAMFIMAQIEANKLEEQRAAKERDILANMESQQQSAAMKAEADRQNIEAKGRYGLDNTILAGLMKNNNLLLDKLLGNTKKGETKPPQQQVYASIQQNTEDIAAIIDSNEPQMPQGEMMQGDPMMGQQNENMMPQGF